MEKSNVSLKLHKYTKKLTKIMSNLYLKKLVSFKKYVNTIFSSKVTAFCPLEVSSRTIPSAHLLNDSPSRDNNQINNMYHEFVRSTSVSATSVG